MKLLLTESLNGIESDKYPKKLYKFRTWNDINHKKLITQNLLYFAKPSSFEDPLDCKSLITYDILTYDEKMSLIKYNLKKRSLINFSNGQLEQKAKELYKSSYLNDNYKIQKHREETFRQFNEQAGILCLTSNTENPKMWEKYADFNKGFCVGFNTSVLVKIFKACGPVIYEDNLPVVLPEPIHSKDQQLIFQVFYKEKKWSFEDEYRALIFHDKRLTLKERVLTIPKDAFSEIILGSQMSDKESDEIQSIVHKKMPHVSIVKK